MRLSDIRIFLIVYLGIVVINLVFFLGTNEPLQVESPFRFLLGALMVFLMPGLVWGEILRFKSRHILETISLSFAITLALEGVLLLINLIFSTNIFLWSSMLFVVSIAGAGLLFVRNGECNFISPLWKFTKEDSHLKYSIPLLTGIILLISVVLYSWGENIMTIDGEKLLHLTYIKYYISMNLSISDLGLVKGMPPLNIIHFWEFLIAGWSKIINVDPLLVFQRSRALIPLLGFSCMYLLIINIFPYKIKAEILIWTVLIMCIGWISLLSPSSLDWVKEDSLRGLMSFMSTAHHADSAMEILLPLIAGFGLMTIRRAGIKEYVIFGFLLFVSFLWHTREFFQSAIYLAIFILTIFLLPNMKKKMIYKRILVVLGLFFVIAVGFYIAMSTFASNQQHSYDEFKLKEIAFSYSIQSILDVRSLFHFPSDIRLTKGLNKDEILTFSHINDYIRKSWNFYLWLILSAFSTIIIIFYGRKEDRQFAMFYILLWFFTLCWGFSQFFMIVLTYSEINFTLPRIIYLFSYICIGAGFYVLFQKFQVRYTNLKNLLILYGSLLIIGLAFMIWWRMEIPLSKGLSYLFSIAFVVSFIAIYYPNLRNGKIMNTKELFPSILAIFIFFAPILSYDYVQFVKKAFTSSNSLFNWNEGNNPLGLSTKMITHLKKIEPKKTVLVNPFGNALVSLYAPVYYSIIPEVMGKTLVTAAETYTALRQQGHPLFNSSAIKIVSEEDINLKPTFITNISNWTSKNSSIKNDIAKALPPMVLHARNGDFIFEKRGDSIRLRPSKDNKSGQLFIAFGYAQGDNGFNIALNPESDLLFITRAKLSEKSKSQASAYILEVAEGKQDFVKTDISGSAFNKYVAAKKLRARIDYFAFGIQWIPSSVDDYLEFSSMSIYTTQNISQYVKKIDYHIEHDKTLEWLKMNKTDYIFVNGDDYKRLIDYFKSNQFDYKIVFQNEDTKEVLVNVISKSQNQR